MSTETEKRCNFCGGTKPIDQFWPDRAKCKACCAAGDSMSTECNGCGDCCQPVILSRGAIELARNPRISPREKRWLLEDLRPMSRKLAAQYSPWMFGGNIVFLDGRTIAPPAFYSCRHFNEETRSCMSHDDLPETCSGYPWFGGLPEPHRVLSPHCSYNVDVGRPVELTQKSRSNDV